MAAANLCCLTPEKMYSALDTAGCVTDAVLCARTSIVCATCRAARGRARGRRHRAFDVARALHLFEQFFEIVGSVANCLVSLLRLFRQTLADDALQFR